MSALTRRKLSKVLWLLPFLALLAGMFLVYLAPVIAQETPGTTVEIDPPQVQATTGDIIILDIVIRNITDPDGLGAYNLFFGFDVTVVEFVQVLGGDPPFNEVLAFNFSVIPGSEFFSLGSLQPQIPGPTGDIIVARVEMIVTGEPGEESLITPEVAPSNLIDTNADLIEATGVNEQVTIVAA